VGFGNLGRGKGGETVVTKEVPGVRFVLLIGLGHKMRAGRVEVLYGYEGETSRGRQVVRGFWSERVTGGGGAKEKGRPAG